MHEHDLHRRAVLVVVGRVDGEVDAVGEGGNRRGGEPRQHAARKRQETRRVGEVDQRHWSHMSGPPMFTGFTALFLA
jgi:hypothetical protein